jgi:hypothetical protein
MGSAAPVGLAELIGSLGISEGNGYPRFHVCDCGGRGPQLLGLGFFLVKVQTRR